eukprot:CAMPEP_0203856082 /NCGR_PEP_ID=MMETSP0359-20131031/9979_1 /ASSEMBLY_ACC=CAM_ASM_000338 /TAXON_ID=268821 /ORGANISM="Scrippsiella Hangoei, Strain SHTV-5" /LENGTH=362 /DNA_ID=CAMNT_0050772667 /DNA_START=43 /DNA_END=1131 /DNA_ORIENTATION=+
MIYIFKACDGSCKGCGQACDRVCSGCGGACAKICEPLNKVLERPLGGFVLFTAFLCLPATICAAISMVDEEVTKCDKAIAFCAANVALGVMHFGVALYLQIRLTHRLQKDGQLTASGSSTTDQAAQNLTAKELMERAGHIVLYDVVFCLYAFVFAGSFFFQFVGLSWISGCRISSSLPYIASTLLILFCMMAISFAFCWWFAMLCEDCCGMGMISRLPPQSAPAQPRRRRGPVGAFFGFLFGNQGGKRHQQQQTGGGTIIGVPAQVPIQAAAPSHKLAWMQVEGVAVPPLYVAQPPKQQQQQQQHQQKYPPASAPPQQPPQQPTAATTAQAAAGTAASVAGVGLHYAGRGLQAAGRWMEQKK